MLVILECHEGSSPLTRGALSRLLEYTTICGIIPAYAGSTPVLICKSIWPRDHPRLRGEHFQHLFLFLSVTGSSPLTRGAHFLAALASLASGIIPAYAGSTEAERLCLAINEDHPRLRGEHAVDRLEAGPPPGSSPLTRGAPMPRKAMLRHGRIIPAYAGSTSPPCARSCGNRDHPRLRGEHDTCTYMPMSKLGSSPLTRGALAIEPVNRRHARIIPAYAGSTRTRGAAGWSMGDHPRLRGEHSDCITGPYDIRGSSPLTRGAPALRCRTRRCRRIIPAYAGSTRFRDVVPVVLGDHPRLRGEHT